MSSFFIDDDRAEVGRLRPFSDEKHYKEFIRPDIWPMFDFIGARRGAPALRYRAVLGG